MNRTKKLNVDYKVVMIEINSCMENYDTVDLSSVVEGIETRIKPANRFTSFFWKWIKIKAYPVLVVKPHIKIIFDQVAQKNEKNRK